MYTFANPTTGRANKRATLRYAERLEDDDAEHELEKTNSYLHQAATIVPSALVAAAGRSTRVPQGPYSWREDPSRKCVRIVRRHEAD